MARSRGLDGFSIASSSSRTLVYKGLVAGSRLGAFQPDLLQSLDVPFTVFHQRYATNTTPTWALAQPFGFLAHNGEINTVRGNREAVRGRRHDGPSSPVRRAAARRLPDAGPLLSEGGSDSCSLDEAVELLASTGWSVRGAARAGARCRRAASRAPPGVDAFRPGSPGSSPLGRPRGARLRRWPPGRRDPRSQRAASRGRAVTRDRSWRSRPRPGAVPSTRGDRAPRRVWGPARCCSWTRRRARSRRRRGQEGACAACRIHDAPGSAPFGDRLVVPSTDRRPTHPRRACWRARRRARCGWT